MLAHVKKHTASFWAQSFIKVLMASIAASEQSSFTPILETETLLKHYTQSKKRLLCFDYDVSPFFLKKKDMEHFYNL
jgi:hypothetical protein